MINKRRKRLYALLCLFWAVGALTNEGIVKNVKKSKSRHRARNEPDTRNHIDNEIGHSNLCPICII